MKRMHALITRTSHVSMVFGIMAMLMLSACDTTSVATDQDVSGDLDVPAVALIETLDLSNEEAQQVADIMSKYDTRQPGRLWYVSAELQQMLPNDEKAELIASVEEGRRAERGASEDSARRSGYEKKGLF